MSTTEIAKSLKAQARAKGPLGTAHWTNGTVRAYARPVHSHSTTALHYAVVWFINGNRTTEKAAATFLADDYEEHGDEPHLRMKW